MFGGVGVLLLEYDVFPLLGSESALMYLYAVGRPFELAIPCPTCIQQQSGVPT